MKRSADRILTTHTGSLPRPDRIDRHDPLALRAAVQDVVHEQQAVGVDIVNDGEMSKPSYATYVTERLRGFGGDPIFEGRRGLEEFPEYAQQMAETIRSKMGRHPSCDAPVAYPDRTAVHADIANLRAATGDADEVFMSAASPGLIAMFMGNRFYPSTDEFLFAVAEAMKVEYDAIYEAGFVLQLDCPDLAAGWLAGPALSIEEFRTVIAQRLEALNHAVRDIPPHRLRMHVCWGNFEGPHLHDIPLADIIDLVLAARPAAVSFASANPRHGHEWKLFEDVKLPDGKVLIPGVLDSTTNNIEHPQLVAQRLIAFARLVGRENVIAGSDCGFSTFAGVPIVDPRIAWAKLAAMSEGARIASAELWH